MTQTYTNIQSTDIVGESLTPLKDRDQANKTNFMGTSFPEVTSDDIGMTCVIIKTENGVDYKQVWRLIGVLDNQPQWLLERDLTKGIVYSDTVSDQTINSYQEANTLLTSLSTQEATGQQSNANKVPYLSSTNTFALADITAKAREFLAAVDAAEQRGVLGLGSLATKNSVTGSDIAANTVTLSNMATGTYNKTISYTAGGVPILVDLPDSVPVGAIMMWSSTILPNKYIWLDGRQLSISEYPDLWEHASGSYNIVADYDDWVANRKGSFYQESTTTFRVPDLRNYFIRPWDGPEGPTRVIGSTQGDAIRNITGSIGPVDRVYESTRPRGAFYTDGGIGSSGWTTSNGSPEVCFDASLVVPTANENRPVNIALPFIMKAKK